MIPEAGQGGSVDIYACESFPDQWRKRASLMQNLRYADATLLQRDQKWWLFITIKRGLFSLSRDLFLFWAETPVATTWKAHPQNPIIRGLKGARPAGRLFEIHGRLFRPSQNCLPRYGYGLRINEVTFMDKHRYEERLATEVNPDWDTGVIANHHIDWHEGLLVMDAQRLLPLGSAKKTQS